MLRYTTKSPEETFRIGSNLSKFLLPGHVICLSGDLGAGKTAFTQGIGKGLGVTDYITSPTYTIINEYYTGRIPLFHFDVYRLASPDEMFELGCDEYFFGNGITVIEWADNILSVLPQEKLWITINTEKNPNKRTIIIEEFGDKYKGIIEGMEKLENPCN